MVSAQHANQPHTGKIQPLCHHLRADHNAVFARGKIAGSINLPVDEVPSKIESVIPDKSALIYVYCLSGARSAKAVTVLEKLGYTNVTNIGGISAYTGEIE